MIIQEEIYQIFLYHQNYYKFIDIDLSRQTNTKIPQQINFAGKLEKDDGATMIFVAEKQQKTLLKPSLDLLTVTKQYNNGTTKSIKFTE